MVCYFCKRDENEIHKTFSGLISNLEKNISELENRIKIKKNDYQVNNGFTGKNIAKLKNIDRNLLNMEIIFFKKHFDVLLKLEPCLDLLMSYVKEFNPAISDTDSLELLINQFMNEPTDERLYPVVKDMITKKDKIISDVEEIKKNIKFKEIENKNEKIIYKYEEKIMLRIIKEKQYYFEMNKEKPKPEKIYLCPYCFYLFDTFDVARCFHEEMFQIEVEKLKGRYNHIKEWDFD